VAKSVVAGVNAPGCDAKDIALAKKEAIAE
jgi:hypothetical protein